MGSTDRSRSRRWWYWCWGLGGRRLRGGTKLRTTDQRRPRAPNQTPPLFTQSTSWVVTKRIEPEATDAYDYLLRDTHTHSDSVAPVAVSPIELLQCPLNSDRRCPTHSTPLSVWCTVYIYPSGRTLLLRGLLGGGAVVQRTERGRKALQFWACAPRHTRHRSSLTGLKMAVDLWDESYGIQAGY